MENIITDKNELIDKLREVYVEKGLSYDKIVSLAEVNGDHVSKSTLSRLFTKGSTDYNFKYEETLRPIARVLLDMESIEENDDLDVQAMKSILKFKMDKIEVQQKQLDQEIFAREKVEKELEQARKSIEFLKDQILLKDQRIDALLGAAKIKDEQIQSLLNEIINCPRRKECQ